MNMTIVTQQYKTQCSLFTHTKAQCEGVLCPNEIVYRYPGGSEPQS